jgi:replicative DNA helicase
MNEQGGEPTKVPPHNIEAEQSVIGGILLNNEVLPSV